MADCFFLHGEMINCDVTNSTVLHFYAGIEENDILLFFSRKFEIYSFISLEWLGMLLIRISFFSIFKGLSNKSHLYFACSFVSYGGGGGRVGPRHQTGSQNSTTL